MDNWILLFGAFLGTSSSLGAAVTFASEDWVSTPGGLRPRSSVIEVRSGEVFPVDSGENKGHAAVNSQGWISYSSWTAPPGKPIQRFVTRWSVPNEPARKENQLIYLFNGIMNVKHTTILQPVLQWGVSPAGGGGYWAVASWFVNLKGETFHTPLIRVQPGEVLTGVMTLIEDSDSKFSYVSEFDGIPKTVLRVHEIEELREATETLEAYRVHECTAYPVGTTAFSDISLELPNGLPSLLWTVRDRVTNCGQHVTVVSDSATNGDVELSYGSSNDE
ncbi:MAG: hypothetical protein P4M08_08020 [Oligoflexia bacterium]|nr:hypothetical protein [Oligoflexia bacterium]